jgi:AsmA-like C-terminal region
MRRDFASAKLRTKKRWTVPAAVAVALCASAFFLILRWPFSQTRIVRSLQETFPVTVTFQNFRPTYFPHPGCVAAGVSLQRLGSSAQTPPIVTIQKLKIQGHYLDLLFRPGFLARIATKGFLVRVPPTGTHVQETGWRETPSNIRVGEIVLDGSAVEIARTDDKSALRFDIHKLRLGSVSEKTAWSYELAIHNPLPPGEIYAHGKFGPYNSGDTGETPIAGEYDFEKADLGVFEGIAGTLSSRDKFQGKLKEIETQGAVDVPNFEVTRSKHPIHLTSKYHALVNGTNGDVTLERVSATFLKTRIEAKGEIAGKPGLHGKTASVDLTVLDGRIQDVLRLFVREPKPPLNGVTEFRAHVVIPPGNQRFLQKVRLSGDFGIAGGQFTKPSTQEKVGDFSERASGEKPEDQDPADKERVISNLFGHVELRDTIATFTNFSFVVPGATAQMHGTYGLESRKVDLHGTLKSTAELSKMTTGVKSVLLKPFDALFKKKRAGAVVPAHLIGTYDDPQPGLDIPSKKPPQKPNSAVN